MSLKASHCVVQGSLGLALRWPKRCFLTAFASVCLLSAAAAGGGKSCSVVLKLLGAVPVSAQSLSADRILTVAHYWDEVCEHHDVQLQHVRSLTQAGPVLLDEHPEASFVLTRMCATVRGRARGRVRIQTLPFPDLKQIL